MNIPLTRNLNPKPKPDSSKLGFGNYFSDHMFIMEGDVKDGWREGEIVPYGPLSLAPAAMVLHYGQERG